MAHAVRSRNALIAFVGALRRSLAEALVQPDPPPYVDERAGWIKTSDSEYREAIGWVLDELPWSRTQGTQPFCAKLLDEDEAFERLDDRLADFARWLAVDAPEVQGHDGIGWRELFGLRRPASDESCGVDGGPTVRPWPG